MKILFVLEHYYPFIGGAEVLFKQVCEGLVKKGHIVTVITSRLPQTSTFEIINGVSVYRINTSHRASRYWFTFLAVPLSIRMARSVDIIQTTTYNGAFPAWLASRLTGRKCIITVHEVIAEGWRSMMGMNPIMACLHRSLEHIIIILPFDHYIAVSSYTAERIKRCGVKKEKISTVYNGIDYELFDPQKADGRAVRSKLGLKDEFIYMYYGRPGISKGLEYLIRAVPLISEKISHAKLLMILGKMPSDGYKRITDLIKELHVEKSVILLEPVPRNQLPSYIAAADCVVVPSISEGFGFTAIEACAMRRPVVASNVASLPEVISGTFKLVPPADPSALADGIHSVFAGTVTTSEEKHFYWSDCINGYEKLYYKLIDNDFSRSRTK